jgi:hypothetical protein
VTRLDDVPGISWHDPSGRLNRSGVAAMEAMSSYLLALAGIGAVQLLAAMSLTEAAIRGSLGEIRLSTHTGPSPRLSFGPF